MNAFNRLFPENEPVIGLAPMAGFTTPAFRGLAAHFGASYTVTELVSARGITYDRGLCRSLRYLAPPDTFSHVPFLDFPASDNAASIINKRPWGIQLFGSVPADFAAAIDLIFEETQLQTAAFVDINMGCPVPKVAKEGAGAALMGNPLLCGRIVEAAERAASRHGRFITVKIRLGLDQASINAPLVAKTVVSAGATAVTCHARTADQFYSGYADWPRIAQVKDVIDVPVIGNGDLVTAGDLIKMRNETGCDGFAIGRASRGNPRLFMTLRRDLNLCSDQESRQDESTVLDSNRLSAEAWLQIMMAQLDATIERLGEAVAVREMRSSLAFYLKGFPGAATFRSRVMKPETRDGVVAVLRDAADSRAKHM